MAYSTARVPFDLGGMSRKPEVKPVRGSLSASVKSVVKLPEVPSRVRSVKDIETTYLGMPVFCAAAAGAFQDQAQILRRARPRTNSHWW